jgi:hypothetical protein
MTVIAFAALPAFSREKLEIAEPWLVALEELGVSTYLKLVVTGSWTPMAGLGACGPDGVHTSAIPDDRLILTDCPAGALIGRIGGSSASLKAATPDGGESKPFAIGSHAVIKLPDNAVGPLFIGFNILIRPLKLEKLEVTIMGGRPP